MNNYPTVPCTGSSQKNSFGFSLVEFLVSSTILLVISVTLFGALNGIQLTAGTQADVQEVTDNMRIALQEIERVIRQAGNDPHRFGFEAISIMGPDEVRIRSDLTGSESPASPNKGDPDGDINDSRESISIRYNYKKRRLEMISGDGPAQIIADNISAFSLQYFDAEGRKTENGSAVRKIVVTITGSVRPKARRMGRLFGIQLSSTIRILS